MGVDRRTKHRFQQYQERTNFKTMPRTLQREQRKYCHHRRLRHRSWNSIMAVTKQWRPKTNCFRQPIPQRRRKKIFSRRTRTTGGSMGIRTVQISPVRKTSSIILQPPSPGTAFEEE